MFVLCFHTQQSLTDKDYFARSHDPRDPRPAHVRYRVGQVMVHRVHGYRGVIIGWDPICKVMSILCNILQYSIVMLQHFTCHNLKFFYCSSLITVEILRAANISIFQNPLILGSNDTGNFDICQWISLIPMLIILAHSCIYNSVFFILCYCIF